MSREYFVVKILVLHTNVNNTVIYQLVVRLSLSCVYNLLIPVIACEKVTLVRFW